MFGGMGVLGRAASCGLAAMVRLPIFRVGAWQFLIRSLGFVHALGHALEFSKTVSVSTSPVLRPQSWAASLQASAPVFTFPVLLACYTLALTLCRASSFVKN